MNPNYLRLNGEYFEENELNNSFSNRAFKYGDALFETLFVSNGSVHFFYDHIERINKGMQILKMEIPVKFLFDTIGLQSEILSLVNKNRHFKGARVRLTVFRNGDGFYMPQSNEVSYLLETSRLENNFYELNEKGLKINVFTDVKKPINIFSSLKTTNTLLYIYASLCKETYDDLILINENNQLIESISSNLFLFQNGILITPDINSGCIEGVMRKNVLILAKKLFRTIEIRPIFEEDLIKSDEIILTNVIKGIQWVGAYNNKRFYNNFAKIITTELNKKITPKN